MFTICPPDQNPKICYDSIKEILYQSPLARSFSLFSFWLQLISQIGLRPSPPTPLLLNLPPGEDLGTSVKVRHCLPGAKKLSGILMYSWKSPLPDWGLGPSLSLERLTVRIWSLKSFSNRTKAMVTERSRRAEEEWDA